MEQDIYFGAIKLDPNLNYLFTEQAKALMDKYYMHPDDEGDYQKALARPALAFCAGDQGLAQRIYEYAAKRWFMYASPVLSNAPSPKTPSKGLPISCFLNYVGDNLPDLMEHTTETRWLSVKGGGVGGHWSDVRAVSDIAPGPLTFIKTVDTDITVYRQGKTRRASYAAYMDISHPDIIQFINTRVPTGGDLNSKCLNIHNAVNITEEFMNFVQRNEEWELKCPHSGEVKEKIMARDLWQRILEVRYRTGEPYLNFIDEANKHLPQEMKEKGLKIHGSNLCNEIHLPTNSERTAVCCLSSVNLEKYEEWKDTTMVADLIRFLDNVLQYFIDHAPDELSRARFSASQERSLGLGAMGFHAFLQSKNLPWESAMAKSWNKRIFQHIKDQAVEETKKLAEERGSCPDVEGVRNSHLMAIAPNANSGMLCGTSYSIEPISSNSYKHLSRAGTHFIRNKYLVELLEELGYNTEEVWDDITAQDGSVQHLDFLTEDQKEVFKTAIEIDQRWVIEHAADRQPFICQGQSVNVFFPKGADKAYVNAVHILGFTKKLKGLYYLRTKAPRKVESVNKQVERKALKDFNGGDECIACQG